MQVDSHNVVLNPPNATNSDDREVQVLEPTIGKNLTGLQVQEVSGSSPDKTHSDCEIGNKEVSVTVKSIDIDHITYVGVSQISDGEAGNDLLVPVFNEELMDWVTTVHSRKRNAKNFRLRNLFFSLIDNLQFGFFGKYIRFF